MFHVASTRFNNKTYKENIQYRENHDEKVIYGTDIKINAKYTPGSLIFVIEMNNEKNKIEGIGLIRNNIVYDKKHKIYENFDYNRYIYRGDYWISRENILSINKELVDICELILFTGKSHMKRVSGISIITEKLFTNWVFEFKEFKDKIKELFLVMFGNIQSNTNLIK
jgi:hypothetical protein